MNRKEVIEFLKHIRLYFDTAGDSSRFQQAIEVLEQPPTLAEFLGWEEGVEYESDGHKFKVKNDSLTMLERNDEYWGDFDYSWDSRRINWLRQATKVEQKLKAYHVTDEYSFNELMKELEEQGCVWLEGMVPTKMKFKPDHRGKCEVIYVNKINVLMYSDLEFYKRNEKDKYDLIEYHKEKPRYYAKIKGWEVLGNDIFYFYEASDKKIYLTTDKHAKHLTKTEWNELGINDTNADFEEVTE